MSPKQSSRIFIEIQKYPAPNNIKSTMSTIQQKITRYAKRQMTWFSSKDYVNWIDADRDGNMRGFEEIFDEASVLMRERGFVKM